MHPGQRAVLLHSRLDLHQDGMAAPVAVEDLLARQADLDGAAGHEGELRDHDLVAEGIAFPAEPAAVGGGDHADPGGRHPEDLRERAVHVVGGLGARPDDELPVGVDPAQGRVLLHRQVGVPLEEVGALQDLVGRFERPFNVPELEGDLLVDVPLVAVRVDPGLGGRERLLRREDRGQRLVLDLDRVHRVEGGVLVQRRHGGDGVAREADAVQAEGVLVLGDREDPEGDREVLPGQDGDHARHPGRLGEVDPLDPRVRHGRTVDLAEEHPGEDEVVGELRHARALRQAVDLPDRGPDDLEAPLHRSSFIRRAASSTAS